MRLRIVTFALAAGLLAAAASHAQVPRLVSYQGFLSDAGGPVSGAHSVAFRLYDVASGGTALWTETRSLALDAGLFATTLGEVTALTLPFDRQYWLGITVDGGTELAPRTKLSGSPYSMRASSVADGAIVGSSIASGTVVKSLNGLQDAVTLAAGSNVSLGVSGNTLTINSTGGASSWTVSGVNQYSANTGNVGIGTTSPIARLHVSAATGDALRVQQAGTTRLLLDSVGRLAVGANFTPQSALHVSGGQWDVSATEGDLKIGDTVNRLLIGVATGGGGAGTVRLRAKGSSGGAIMLGTGSADALTVNAVGNVGIGTTVPTERLEVAGTIKTSVITITGGSDLAEPFEASGEEALEPGMVVSIDPDEPGRLRPSAQSYDRRVAGIVSGAGGVRPGLTLTQEGTDAHGRHPVALSGRVYCRVDATDGPIEPGDLLTTSDTPGHARKVSDFARANGAILGKALTRLDSGRGLVLVLVGLQ